MGALLGNVSYQLFCCRELQLGFTRMFLLDQLKTLPLFQSPEVTLKRKLDDNPTYPFEPVILSPTDQYPGWWRGYGAKLWSL